ncbi:tRNA uracil 4-sulfurtransferase ThiI [uncultured Finegoldia sp.]|uniref:tRNA uracil 4-sulfurtransferase ThiI n=1 Tax=uncultured Finegoldia sp. TaxID=328009 RepID=UPI00260FA02B|nr:tRNA uracil 4-sulfurtransferase ThiI [uncultured Finegoldia sp.]
MLDWYISVSFGELTLKGKNRHTFEKRAISKILSAISKFYVEEYYQEQGKLYIKANVEEFDEIINEIKKVFGIVYISPCVRCEKKVESIQEGVLEIIKGKLNEDTVQTFKVDVHRVDKRFEPKSPELNPLLGGTILKKYGKYFKVDIKNPDFFVYVDIKDNCYVYTDRVKGWGGLPIGSSGRGLLLLSGGIDSPVAAFLMAKRGVRVDCLHFHSYPFTSQRGFEKVKQLAHEISYYTGNINFYSVNLLPVYKSISKNCKERMMTIISRRFMMRIAQKIAEENKIDALITGESLGQVASQTIQGVSVINEVTNLPILRPLIASDKTEIIEIARQIGTYDTSILPFEDCCTVFTPKRPVTKPRLYDVKREEENLDIESLVKECLDNMEVIKINQ